MVDKRKEETEQQQKEEIEQQQREYDLDVSRIVWLVAPFVIVFFLLLLAAQFWLSQP